MDLKGFNVVEIFRSICVNGRKFRGILGIEKLLMMQRMQAIVYNTNFDSVGDSIGIQCVSFEIQKIPFSLTKFCFSAKYTIY